MLSSSPLHTLLPVTGATRLLGVIADPVAQARSPMLANQILERCGQLGVFVAVPLHVSTAGLGDVVVALRSLQNVAGAIVSMPHKVAIAGLLDELTPDARLVGAVNVIRRTLDGRIVGHVLDGAGFVAGLLSAGHSVRGASCLLIGAGGAATAIAFELAKQTCARLRIANRTQSKATELARRVRTAFPNVAVESGDPGTCPYDLVINATALGMHSEDPLPVSAAVVEHAGVVADCVVAPEMTRLLHVAQRHGRRIHTGLPMLEAQLGLMLDFVGVEGHA